MYNLHLSIPDSSTSSPITIFVSFLQTPQDILEYDKPLKGCYSWCPFACVKDVEELPGKITRLVLCILYLTKAMTGDSDLCRYAMTTKKQQLKWVCSYYNASITCLIYLQVSMIHWRYDISEKTCWSRAGGM